MSTSPTLLSIEEYLRTSFQPDADYVDPTRLVVPGTPIYLV